VYQYHFLLSRFVLVKIFIPLNIPQQYHEPWAYLWAARARAHICLSRLLKGQRKTRSTKPLDSCWRGRRGGSGGGESACTHARAHGGEDLLASLWRHLGVL
jgi:hypothetical protein